MRMRVTCPDAPKKTPAPTPTSKKLLPDRRMTDRRLRAGGKSGLHRAGCPAVMAGSVCAKHTDGKCHRNKTAGVRPGKGEMAV